MGSVPPDMGDLFDVPINAPTAVPSALFGSNRKAMVSAPLPSTQHAMSTLFGRTLAKRKTVSSGMPRRHQSPTFDVVQHSIHMELEIPGPPLPEEPAADHPLDPDDTMETQPLMRTETVPFVPAASRSTIPSSQVVSPNVGVRLEDPSGGDEVVAVKKKSKKARVRQGAKAPAVNEGLPTGAFPQMSTDGHANASSPDQKARKSKHGNISNGGRSANQIPSTTTTSIESASVSLLGVHEKNDKAKKKKKKQRDQHCEL